MNFVTFITISLTVSFTSAQIDVRSCTNASNAIRKCNTDNGIMTNRDTVLSFLGLAISNVANTCGANNVKIKAAAVCVLNVTRGCGEGEFPKLYPTASSAQSAIDTLCDNKDNFDFSCVNLTRISRCLEDDLQAANLTEPATDADFSIAKTYYCQYMKSFRDCASKDSTLKACKSKPKTKDVFVEQLARWSPEACGAMTTVVTSVLLVASLFISYANNLI